MPVPDQPQAASYERVSTRAQGQSGFSLGAQAKDAAAFAAEHGWSLPEHLRFRDGEDRHASGADWDLPGLNAMLDAARRREFDVLLVPTVDRFARDMTKALVLEQQLRKHGVRVVYVSAPVDDTAEGRLLLRQLQSFAEFEREKIKFRTLRGRREKIERGLVLGSGPAPYGYRYVRAGERNRVVGLDPDPATAPIVQRIFAEALHRSAIEIAELLNHEGIRLPPLQRTIAAWRQWHVLRILTNPTYCGRVLYGAGWGRPRAKAFLEQPADFLTVDVPPLVSLSVWRQAQEATMQRHEIRGGARSPGFDPFLLRGMLVCGHCGGQLSAKWNMGGQQTPYRQYHCIRSRPFVSRRTTKALCVMRDVRAEELEAAVWATVTSALRDGSRLKQGMQTARQRHAQVAKQRTEQLRRFEQDTRRLRTKLERIIDELLETPKGTQSYRTLVERQRDTERELARLQNESTHAATPTDVGLSEDAAAEVAHLSAAISAAIDAASPADRRLFFERLRVRVTIGLDRQGQKIGRDHRYSFKVDAIVDLNAKQAVAQQGPSSVPRNALIELETRGARVAITVRR